MATLSPCPHHPIGACGRFHTSAFTFDGKREGIFPTGLREFQIRLREMKIRLRALLLAFLTSAETLWHEICYNKT